MQTQYIPAEKQCSRCGVVKAVGEYFSFGISNPRLRPHCKTCHAEARSKTWKRGRFDKLAVNIRKRGGRPSVPTLRQALGEPATCYLCGGDLTWATAAVDHVLPVSRGGTHDPVNLRWTHSVCNRMKSDLTIDEFITLAGQIWHHLLSPHQQSDEQVAIARR